MLVEVDGAVITTVRVRTAGCLSLRGLRRRVNAACKEWTGGLGEEGLLLEYLDETARIAVQVVADADLTVALRMSTLKATFMQVQVHRCMCVGAACA